DRAGIGSRENDRRSCGGEERAAGIAVRVQAGFILRVDCGSNGLRERAERRRGVWQDAVACGKNAAKLSAYKRRRDVLSRGGDDMDVPVHQRSREHECVAFAHKWLAVRGSKREAVVFRLDLVEAYPLR